MRLIFYFQRTISLFIISIARFMLFINQEKYMKLWKFLFKSMKLDIEGIPTFVSNKVYFDTTDYSLIHIGDKSVISFNVTILTHDFSITRGLIAAGYSITKEINKVNKVYIGKNCFIGANSLLLPGTIIRDNTIIAAGSVVRGDYPPNVILLGNPAKVVKNTIDWTKQQIEKHPEYQTCFRT